MKFITPKNKQLQKTNWRISEQTVQLVKAYAEYCDYDDSEVVDMFLQNLKDDQNFVNWVLKKRNNRRLLKVLNVENQQEEEANESF